MSEEFEDKNQQADKDFKSKVKKTQTDHDEAVELYQSYVGSAETPEERIRRIHAFRSGGR